MLALIPLTIVMGISANAISGLSTQIVSFSHFFGSEQAAINALDLLVKTPGTPPDWNNSYIPEFESIGLAQHSYIDIYRDTRTISNALDRYKVMALHLNRTNSNLTTALRELTGDRNLVIISNSTDTDLNFSVMWYQDNGTWTVTNNTATIESALAGAKNVYSSTRVVRSVTPILGSAEFIWNFTGTDIIQSTPSIADINCDGENEIVYATNSGSGGTYALYGNGSVYWYYPTGKAYTASPTLVDLDGDCGLEVLQGQDECSGESGCINPNTGDGRHNLTAIDSDGTFMWNFTMSDATWNAPSVADVDYDGDVEVIIGAMPNDRNLYCLNGADGSLEWSYDSGDVSGNYDNKDRYKGSVTIADLDHNAANGLEILGGNCNQYIHAVHGDGSGLYGKYYTNGHGHSAPAVADLDGDGWNEIIQSSNGDAIYVLYYNFTLWWKDTNGAADKPSPAIADLDNSGDGHLEIVTGTDNGVVRAWYYDGTPFWTYTQAEGDKIQSTPAIADIDDDCWLEVVIGSGAKDDTTGTNHLYALNGEDGSLLWAEEVTGAIESQAAIADIDGDGDMEVVVGANGGTLYAFDTTGYGDGWPSYHQAEYFMDSTHVQRRGEWDGTVCGAPSGGYFSIEIRSRVTAVITFLVWE
jgi:outer membrane protein assembly factor BamB